MRSVISRRTPSASSSRGTSGIARSVCFQSVFGLTERRNTAGRPRLCERRYTVAEFVPRATRNNLSNRFTRALRARRCYSCLSEISPKENVRPRRLLRAGRFANGRASLSVFLKSNFLLYAMFSRGTQPLYAVVFVSIFYI